MRQKWRRRANRQQRLSRKRCLITLDNVTRAFEFVARYGTGPQKLAESLKENAQPARNFHIQEENARRQLANFDFAAFERALLKLGIKAEIDR